MDKYLIDFYNEYVATGSNIHEHAVNNGITNTECFTLIKMGLRLVDVK